MVDVLPQLMRLVVLTAGVWLLGGHALALPAAKQTRIVEKARTLLNTPYRFGGRLRGADAGIDCQGLVLFAIQPISTCGWKSYSVFPTVSLPAKELGAIVAGPVATRDLAGLALEPGDVVWLLGFAQNPAEKGDQKGRTKCDRRP